MEIAKSNAVYEYKESYIDICLYDEYKECIEHNNMVIENRYKRLNKNIHYMIILFILAIWIYILLLFTKGVL